KLTLADGSYAWQFIAASGTSRDTGNGTCHRSPATGPVMPLVNAGQDRLAHPGDSVRLSVTFTDPGPNDAPWSYSITWGDGSTADYTNCYNPTWGRQKARTRPVPGNHEYSTKGATPYFSYFGAAAGDPSKGYYSYDLGDWHIIALNSNIAESAGSPQEQWLR